MVHESWFGQCDLRKKFLFIVYFNNLFHSLRINCMKVIGESAKNIQRNILFIHLFIFQKNICILSYSEVCIVCVYNYVVRKKISENRIFWFIRAERDFQNLKARTIIQTDWRCFRNLYFSRKSSCRRKRKCNFTIVAYEKKRMYLIRCLAIVINSSV